MAPGKEVLDTRVPTESEAREFLTDYIVQIGPKLESDGVNVLSVHRSLRNFKQQRGAKLWGNPIPQASPRPHPCVQYLHFSQIWYVSHLSVTSRHLCSCAMALAIDRFERVCLTNALNMYHPMLCQENLQYFLCKRI